MYNNNFVVSIRVKGKILREFKDVVYVPYNSEYSLFLKNLNSRRASVKVSIDGVDVLNGSSLILDANSHMNLERFLKDVNKGNRFKFIERSEPVENHRGIKAEDGLIRIEFAYEKVHTPYPFQYYPPFYYPVWPNIIGSSIPCTLTSSGTGNVSSLSNTTGSVNLNNVSCGLPQNASVQKDEVGITVPGSISTQKFQTVSGFATDPSEVIVLRLVGEMNQAPVVEAITVKSKIECTSCGRHNKAANKFCSNCGTSLELIEA